MNRMWIVDRLPSYIVGSAEWAAAKQAPAPKIKPKSAWGRGLPAAVKSKDTPQVQSGTSTHNGSRGQ